MATIHLMVGFIGFGKTTFAKQLAQELSAVRLTHDEIMVKRYGRNPDDFATKYQLVDNDIRKEASKYIKENTDVIMDYGFWTHAKREEYYTWAKTLTDDIIFHVIECDIKEAKRRILKRTKSDNKELVIDENAFDTLLKQYEPWNDTDNYPVVFDNAPVTRYIGATVKIKIDRPLGSKHPKYGFEYPINYGFLPFTTSGDKEELDAYILGINEPLKEYIGHCIGIIHRIDDNDDKLIVVPESVKLSNEEIERQIIFQEKWFKHILIR